MRIAICDDSALSREQFTSVLREWDGTQCPECFSSGAELIKAAAELPAFDIAFIDICFPGENGIDIAAKIRKLSPETGIVFLTNSEDHAVDAYTVDALHYLVKPPTTEAVGEAFRRLESFRSRQRPTLSLAIERDTVTVYLEDIFYIVSDGHTKEIHLTDGRVLRVRMQFRELEEKLDKTFLKLNKGTIVNMEQIRTMNKDYCLLRDGTKLAFTRRERVAIRNTYDQFVYARLFEKEEECR